MSEVKWIKIKTDMFDDKKIRMIESMPEADAILIIWIRLITMAGECNSNGYIYFTESKPYTDDMLATMFNKPVSIIRLALKTFLDFNMIEIDERGIYLINFWKHQNIDGLDKIREQNRLRFRKYYENKKLLKLSEQNSNVRTNVDLTHSNATDIDIELDIDKEKDKNIMSCKQDRSSSPKANKYLVIVKEVIDYLNQECGTSYKYTTRKTQDYIKARVKEGFGLDDFKMVVDNMVAVWLCDEKMRDYLRPETLFGTKFESYLNRVKKTNKKEWWEGLEDEQ